jgi:putative transposase
MCCGLSASFKHAPEKFGSGSTLHRRFQQWRRRGIFKRLWRLLLRTYDEGRGISWRWQAIDRASVKAPLGGVKTGKNPTDRGKLGSKRHILCDQRGAPTAVLLSGANRHWRRAALPTVDAIVMARAAEATHGDAHLCGDKGYDDEDIRDSFATAARTVHIPRRGEAKFSGTRTHRARAMGH